MQVNIQGLNSFQKLALVEFKLKEQKPIIVFVVNVDRLDL